MRHQDLRPAPPAPSRRAVLLAAGGAALARPALAQGGGEAGFPSKPIALIVPFPPGGATDVTLRALAEAATRRLPQPVVIENRPGAASTLGAAAVARARPDGYLLTQLPISVVRAKLLQRLPFEVPRDFTPILNLSGYTFGCVTRADRFPGGWKDFVAEARRRPGQVSFGSTGANGTPHVTMADLALREGIELNHVPFRGDADGIQAVLGGHVDAMAGSSAVGAVVDGGQARFLHVWTRARMRRWPDAPTLIELGYAGVVVTSPFGVAGPAGLAPGVVRVLHDAFKAAAEDPSYLAALERYDMQPAYEDSAAYAASLTRIVVEEGETIRRLNLTAG